MHNSGFLERWDEPKSVGFIPGVRVSPQTWESPLRRLKKRATRHWRQDSSMALSDPPWYYPLGGIKTRAGHGYCLDLPPKLLGEIEHKRSTFYSKEITCVISWVGG